MQSGSFYASLFLWLLRSRQNGLQSGTRSPSIVISKTFRFNLTSSEWRATLQCVRRPLWFHFDNSLHTSIRNRESHFKTVHLQLAVYLYTPKIKTPALTVFVNKEQKKVFPHTEFGFPFYNQRWQTARKWWENCGEASRRLILSSADSFRVSLLLTTKV